MKNIFFRIIDLNEKGIKTYNKKTDSFDPGLLSGPDYEFTYNDYFVAFRVRDSIVKEIANNNIFIDGFRKVF